MKVEEKIKETQKTIKPLTLIVITFDFVSDAYETIKNCLGSLSEAPVFSAWVLIYGREAERGCTVLFHQLQLLPRKGNLRLPVSTICSNFLGVFGAVNLQALWTSAARLYFQAIASAFLSYQRLDRHWALILKCMELELQASKSHDFTWSLCCSENEVHSTHPSNTAEELLQRNIGVL